MIHALPQRRFRLRLINPRSPLSTIAIPDVIRKMTVNRKGLFAPTGLMVCAAVVPRHWDVEIVDECVTDQPHAPRGDCDIVGITAMTTQAKRAYELADAYRALGVTVVMGGIHPSAMPADALPHCDVVCRGDGETTLPQVIADWQRAKEAGSPGSAADQRCPASSNPKNLWHRRPGGDFTGETPVPQALSEAAGHSETALRGGQADHRVEAWPGLKRVYDWADYPTAPIATPRKDLLDPRQYLVANPIQTTRGCPHSCTFCTTPAVFGRRFRQRSINDIVEEIKEAKEKHNSWCFIFADDDFAGNHQWALELCAALEPLKVAWASQCDILISNNDRLLAAMRRSGCVGLILGLESRKQDTLSEAGKRYVKSDTYEWRIRKIQSHDISLWGAFIFGFDHDTWRDLMFTTRWAQRMNLAMSCFPILTPYPGTALWERFDKAGRLTTRNWEKYNGATVVFEPEQMTAAQLRHAQMAAFAEFFSERSAVQRLKLWPLKKRAWVANLAIARGIRYYYARHGRRVPCFRDFTAATNGPWSDADASKVAEGVSGHRSAAVAESLVQQTEPFRQVSAALAGV